MSDQITREEAIAEMERLRDQLLEMRRAGQELATALWALCLAHEPGTASGLEPALEHARTVAQRYTKKEDRDRLDLALVRARAGVGDKVATA